MAAAVYPRDAMSMRTDDLNDYMQVPVTNRVHQPKPVVCLYVRVCSLLTGPIPPLAAVGKLNLSVDRARRQ